MSNAEQVIQQIGPWEVVMTWPDGLDQHRPSGPQRLEIRPAIGATPEQLVNGLSSTVLRQVKFRSDDQHQHRPAVGEDARRDLSKELAMIEPLLRASVKLGVTKDYLAPLALAYTILVMLGRSSVTADLARMVGKQPETIRAHLKAARSMGLLTSVPGRAGGELTDEARQILAHAQIAGNKSYRAQ